MPLNRGAVWLAIGVAALFLAGCQPTPSPPAKVTAKLVAQDPVQVNTWVIVFKNQQQRDP